MTTQQKEVGNLPNYFLCISSDEILDLTVSGRTLKFETVDGDDGSSVFGSIYNSVRSYFVGEDYVLEYYQSEVYEEKATADASAKWMMTSNATDSDHVDNVTVDWISS